MESKIEKLKGKYYIYPKNSKDEVVEYLNALCEKQNEIIDHLNSQAQPEENKLDKAREEGYQDCLDDIWEEAKGLRGWTEHDGSISATDIEAGLQEAYLNIENKLKTKEDGK